MFQVEIHKSERDVYAAIIDGKIAMKIGPGHLNHLVVPKTGHQLGKEEIIRFGRMHHNIFILYLIRSIYYISFENLLYISLPYSTISYCIFE
jgi:hypothetical protein